VTYENLVANPVEELERMARFAGMTESPRWTASLRRIQFPNRNERWRSALAPEVVATIEAIQREELHRHGYI
jgi:ATP-dependent DNA ligase